MDKCNSPLPETLKASVVSVSSTLRLTFVSISLYNLSRKCLDVWYSPSNPANGLSFTQNVMVTVGSSMSTNGNGSGCSTAQIVSLIYTSDNPATATMSPADDDVYSCLFNPSYEYSLEILPFRTEPSFLQTATCCPALIVPLPIRPTAILPT